MESLPLRTSKRRDTAASPGTAGTDNTITHCCGIGGPVALLQGMSFTLVPICSVLSSCYAKTEDQSMPSCRKIYTGPIDSLIKRQHKSSLPHPMA